MKRNDDDKFLSDTMHTLKLVHTFFEIFYFK